MLRGVAQANLDLGVIQETKIKDGVYTCISAGNSIVARNTKSRHCGGVVVFYCVSLSFSVEVMQQFGPKVVRFPILAGEW